MVFESTPSKDEKLNLMHIAICRLLEPYGYYQFDFVDNKHKQDVFKIIWFSRSVGPNRGIEFLVSALKHCKVKCELHLLGIPIEGYSAQIHSLFPFNFGHHLYLHSFIEHKSILPFLGHFNLGLAIEESINDNKNLTISNKILQYIQAQLPALCSNTIGHLEVASYFPNTIHAVNIEDEFEVAQKIDFLSENRKFYSNEDMLRFNEIFSWEAQEIKLNNLINVNLSDEKTSN